MEILPENYLSSLIMFPNYLQREAVKQILWKHVLKVSINIRRSYVYKCNNNLTKEGYELPDIQFWAHMRSQISKPMPLRNWLFTNRDPFKYLLFQHEVRAGFRHFTESFQ